MAVFLLWLFSLLIGGLLVRHFAFAKFIPAFDDLGQHQTVSAPRIKGMRNGKTARH